MTAAITLDANGNAIISDGLHRIGLDAPIVAALADLLLERITQTGRSPFREVRSTRAILVVPLAAETTAHEAVSNP